MASSRNILISVFILSALVGGYFYFFHMISGGRSTGNTNSENNSAMDLLKNQIDQLNQKIAKQKQELIEKNIKNIPTNPSGVEKQLLETRNELEKLKKQHHSTAKIHHLKVVIISKDDIHARTRTLVGSIHKLHKDIKIVIYGLKLHPNAM